MPSIPRSTTFTDLPVDVLKVVAEQLQDGFSSGSLANVAATSKKLYEATKHALWEVISWDEKSFGEIDLSQETPVSWKDTQYIYLAKPTNDYFWAKLHFFAPDYQTRHQLVHHFFPNIQAIIETTPRGSDTPWTAYISPNADETSTLAEIVKAGYRLNSTEFAGKEAREFIRTVPTPGFTSALMPPTPKELELMGTKPMEEENLRNRVEYLVNMRPDYWFRQPPPEGLPKALVEDIPHATMALKETDGSVFTKIDLHLFPTKGRDLLNTLKLVKAYMLFISMTLLFGFKADEEDFKPFLLELKCLDYDHFESWICMMVSFGVLFKIGGPHPFRVHCEITIPMSGENYGNRTTFTWGLLIHSLDEAGKGDAEFAVPKRVTVDINRAVIPAFEGKVLRAILPVDIGDDAEYEVDLVDATTPV